MPSRTKNSLLNIFTGLIGQFLTQLVLFAVRTVFIYKLGATYLGVGGLFGNILSILSFTELGFGQAIIYALYKPIAQGDENKVGSLMALFRKVYRWMFCIITVLGLSLTPFLDFFVEAETEIPHLHLIYVLYVMSSAVSYLFAYKKSLLFVYQKAYISTTITYWFIVVGAIFQIIVLLLWQNFILFLCSQIATVILSDITIAKKVDKLYPYLVKYKGARLSEDEMSGILKNVKALILYKIGTLSLNSTDNIIISKFVGLLQVGFYSNYLLICSSVSGFLGTVFSSITAGIGHLNATETDDLKTCMFFRINMATFLFYGVSSVCLFTSMSPFILLWIGSEYVLSPSTTFIMAFNQYIGGMLYSSYNYRQTMGLFVQGKMRPIISAVLNIVLSIILAIYYGLPGVLWGTAITRLLTNVWYDPYIVFKRGLKRSALPYFKDYVVKAIAYFAVCGICHHVSLLIELPPLAGLLVTFALTFMISSGIFMLLFGRTTEVQYIVSVIRNSKSILKSK